MNCFKSLYCPIYVTNISVSGYLLMSLVVLYHLLYDHRNQVCCAQILIGYRNAYIIYPFAMLQIYKMKIKWTLIEIQTNLSYRICAKYLRFPFDDDDNECSVFLPSPVFSGIRTMRWRIKVRWSGGMSLKSYSIKNKCTAVPFGFNKANVIVPLVGAW